MAGETLKCSRWTLSFFWKFATDAVTRRAPRCGNSSSSKQPPEDTPEDTPEETPEDTHMNSELELCTSNVDYDISISTHCQGFITMS